MATKPPTSKYNESTASQLEEDENLMVNQSQTLSKSAGNFNVKPL